MKLFLFDFVKVILSYSILLIVPAIWSLAGECCVAYTDLQNLTQPQIECDDYCCGHVNYLLCCSDATKRAEGYLISNNCGVTRYWIEDNYWQVILGTLAFIALYLLGLVYIRNKHKKSRKREDLASSMHGIHNDAIPMEPIQRTSTLEIVLRPLERATDPPSYAESTTKENINTQPNPPSYDEIFTICRN